jgi:hypothetical protein
MKTVAEFEPPDAQTAAREWRQRHAAALAELPTEAVRIDIGRARDGGDFVRIAVEDEYASRFNGD